MLMHSKSHYQLGCIDNREIYNRDFPLLKIYCTKGKRFAQSMEQIHMCLMHVFTEAITANWKMVLFKMMYYRKVILEMLGHVQRMETVSYFSG